MTEDDFEGDDVDVPSASPEIRESYEAALGRFILAFNQVDNLIAEIVETILTRLGRGDLVDECTRRDFWFRLLIFDLLKSSSEGAGIRDVPMKPMREMAGERNHLAHGHFDQNPFSGEYHVVLKDDRAYYSVERLDGLTEKASKASRVLGYCSSYYAFTDPPDL